MVARGEQGESKERATKSIGRLPHGSIGSMKTTSTGALEVAFLQVPLDLPAIEATGFTPYRLKYQGEWSDRGLRHTNLDFLRKRTFTFKVWIPTRED
jgi:hypothetical protein